MRPIKLTMSAFGPYTERQQIDMDRLGERGLYLITGDTGSGKTTIFDAIVFALYGGTSGGLRDADMLRSKNAPPSIPTFVELEFINKDKTYRIKRNPEYERAAKRGNGTARQRAEAELYLPDGAVITKQKEVDSAVIDILGLDRNQFMQIAMIAQGDFLRLLHAGTDERISIFRSIFKTEKYKQLQSVIKDDLSELDSVYQDSLSRISAYIDAIHFDDGEEIGLAVNEFKKGNADHASVAEALRGDIDRCRSEKLSVEDSIKRMDDELAVLNERVGKLNELKRMSAERLTVAERYGKLGQDLEQIRQSDDEYKAGAAEIDKLILERESLLKSRTNYERLEKLRVLVDESEKKLTNIDRDADKIRNLIVQYNERVVFLQDKVVEIGHIEEQVKILKMEIDSLVIFRDRIRGLIEDKREYDEIDRRYNSALDALQEKMRIVDSERLKYQTKYNAFLSGQAGILAKGLAPGSPCPVCGSTEHPSPAIIEDDFPSSEEIKALKDQVEIAELYASDKASYCAGIKGMRDVAIAKINDGIKRAFGKNTKITVMTLDDELKARDELLKSKQAELGGIIGKVIEVREAQSQIECCKAAADTSEGRLKEKEAAHAECELELSGLKASINTIRQMLDFDTRSEAEQRISELDLIIELYHKERDEIGRRLSDVQKEYIDCGATLAQLDKQIGALQSQTGEEVVTLARDLNLELERARARQSELINRLSVNCNAVDKIRREMDGVRDTEVRLGWMKSLYATACGGNLSNGKVQFETYILINYFDRITRRANLRLMSMSSGRYELIRDKKLDSRAQSGLDLNVIDHYTGGERSVKSLSGGESFMASLALALGLSDEVQSHSGGIRLDVLFVDEGFGSLDGETLDLAVKALKSIAESNRLVGIISHVDGLKDRVNSRIVVKKGSSGQSRASIEI